ncbi:hypothetical protein [Qipengyuania atrilutea]|uniref:Uncharacterized protein n=1 Tax=Qipengyuania atrilutea TaxID=2744473 RepID=A0A850H353_9SPHN|nr:hypothetical protein [Actirhodobacter atriluteus]NVD43475.1 hypothetical protein [Actirhodobacter atriluteus]
MTVPLHEEGRGRSVATLPAEPSLTGFDFSDLQTFRSVPTGQNFDVVAMHGLVIVFDRLAIHQGFIAGKLYVRESQRPHGAMPWSSWLDTERQYGDRAGPTGPLRTRREVVHYISHPATGGPSLRLPCGHIDGPYKDHAFGRDLIGKVIGVYQPGRQS